MADSKISALPEATDLDGAVVPILKGGANKRAPATLFGNVRTDGSITNIIALTQEEYDLLTPDAATLYIIKE